MANKIVLRSGLDRIRHTIMFETGLIAVLAPVGAIVFDRPIWDIGLLSLVLSLKAMLINLIYNWLYDRMDARAGRVPTERSMRGRVLHAIGFEISLVATSLPIVTWWLGISILEAILMDVVVTSFVVFYTVLFGWCYDRTFPVLQTREAC